jgi:hypothetical protein
MGKEIWSISDAAFDSLEFRNAPYRHAPVISEVKWPRFRKKKAESRGYEGYLSHIFVQFQKDGTATQNVSHGHIQEQLDRRQAGKIPPP